MQSSVVGIAFSFVLAAAKCAAGFVGHSFALVADGIESLSDVVSSTVVYFGLKIAIKPPGDDHSYDHGKAEPISAIVVSLALILAAIFIAAESILRIREPHSPPMAYTLWVLLAVVIVKVFLSRYVTTTGKNFESNALRSDAFHHLSDAITSVLALVGISVALWTRNPAADDWAALAASPVILLNAVKQLRSPMAELLDAVPSPEIERTVRAIASDVLGVVGLEKCHVRKMGFRYYVDLHIIVDGFISVWQGRDIAHNVEDTVRKIAPHIAKVLVYIEPDRTGRRDPGRSR